MTARNNRGRPAKAGEEYVRGVHKLTPKEYLALHQLYPSGEVMAFPGSPDGRCFARLYKMGYAHKMSSMNINDGRESLIYKISEDGLLRLLNPGLLFVQTVMER